ncbi:MAG: anti-sigma factor family protein, partial [Trebonia sp.]
MTQWPSAPQAMDCLQARIALGVYVVGAIDPAERAQVDAHLATCGECRDELAGLAGLPALLARVSKEEAIALAAPDGPLPVVVDEAPEPPRELLATVLDLTAARRRGRRWREAGIGIAAALIIAAGVFGGLRLGSSPSPAASAAGHYLGPPAGPAQTATGTSGGMLATVSYGPMGWGTQLDTKVSGIPVGTNCQLWVIDSAGHRYLAAAWVTDNLEGRVWYPGSIALSSGDVAAFEVTVGHVQAIHLTSSTA